MPNNHTFLTLHVGQAGIQVGHALWELLCLEHNITPDGVIVSQECEDPKAAYDSVFVRAPSGHYLPRSVFVDTDPVCIDEVRAGQYKQLFSERQLVNDIGDAGGNFVLGRHSFNGRLLPEAVERLRWLMEKTDSTPTMLSVHSTAGGTGSGFTAALLQQQRDDLGRKLNSTELSIMPGARSLLSETDIVNTALYHSEVRDLTDVSFCVANSSLFNVCVSNLGLCAPTFAHANRLLATAISNLTATERYPGSMPCSMSSICTNVLPFRYLKYPVLTTCPFMTDEGANKAMLTVPTITNSVFDNSNQFLDFDIVDGKFMACALIYRGCVRPLEVSQAAQALKSDCRLDFVDWCPIGFKIGIVDAPPLSPPLSGMGRLTMSVTLVANTTSVATVFSNLADSTAACLNRRLFLHHYSREGCNAEMMLTRATDFLNDVAGMYTGELPGQPDSRANSVAGDRQPEEQQQQQQQQPEQQPKEQQQEVGGEKNDEDDQGGLSRQQPMDSANMERASSRLGSSTELNDSVVEQAEERQPRRRHLSPRSQRRRNTVPGHYLAGSDWRQFEPHSSNAVRRPRRSRRVAHVGSFEEVEDNAAVEQEEDEDEEEDAIVVRDSTNSVRRQSRMRRSSRSPRRRVSSRREVAGGSWNNSVEAGASLTISACGASTVDYIIQDASRTLRRYKKMLKTRQFG